MDQESQDQSSHTKDIRFEIPWASMITEWVLRPLAYAEAGKFPPYSTSKGEEILCSIFKPPTL